MKNPNAKFGFDPRLFAEFIEEFREKLAAVTSSVEVLNAFIAQKARILLRSHCDVCSEENCSELCDGVAHLLDGPYAGKIHGEGTINLSLDNVRDGNGSCDDLDGENGSKQDRGTLKNIQKVSSPDFFSEYEACWQVFSRKQQQVLPLYHRDGKTIARIAKELRKAPSTVWGLLSRAEIKRKKYYEKKNYKS